MCVCEHGGAPHHVDRGYDGKRLGVSRPTMWGTPPKALTASMSPRIHGVAVRIDTDERTVALL